MIPNSLMKFAILTSCVCLLSVTSFATVSVSISQPANDTWAGASLQDTKDGEGNLVSENTDSRSSVTIDASIPTDGEVISTVVYEYRFDAAEPWNLIQTLTNGVDDLDSFTIEWDAAAALDAYIDLKTDGNPAPLVDDLSLTSNESADGNHFASVHLRVTVNHSGGTSVTGAHIFHLDNEQPQVDPVPQIPFPYYTNVRTVAPNWLAGSDSTSPETDSTVSVIGDVAGVDSYRVIINQVTSMVLPRIENKTNLPTNVTLSGPEADPFYMHVRSRDANINANGANWTETRSWGPILLDMTPPEVAVSPNAGSVPCDPITFTVTFNELVDDHPQVGNQDLFDPSTEVTISNGIFVSATEGTGAEENLVWYIVVDPTNPGNVTLTVPAGVTHDQAGNDNNTNSGTVIYTAGDVTFLAASTTVAEDAGPGSLTVQFNGDPSVPLPCEFYVDIVVSGGTATAADYTFPAIHTLTFPVGTVDGATVVVPVVIIDDTVLECGESVEFRLQNVQQNDAISLGATTLHAMQIDEDALDTASVAFAVSSVSHDESAGIVNIAVEFQATPGRVLQCPLTVDVRDLQNGSASGTDYTFTPTTKTATFNPGAGNGTTAVVTLAIVDDNWIECQSETINFVLENITSDVAVVLGATTAHQATILASDSTSVSISATDPAGDESGPDNAVFTVSLDSGNSTQYDLAFSYSVSGTATNGSDYTSLSGLATIAAGNTSATVTVAVQADSQAECDETVSLTLTGVTCGSLNGAASTDSATISETAPTVSVSVSDSDAVEPANDGAFQIALDGGQTAERNITVSYTVGGTATNGTDYASLSGVATIPAGNTGVSVLVDVSSDTLAECDETVVLTLTGASCGVANSASSQASLTITDDEPEISISANDASAAEDAANDGQFTISLDSGTAERTITVSYSIAGTAQNGTDYTLVSGTATINAGAGSATVDITVTDDSLAECDETVVLTLTGTGCGSIDSAGSTATVTITDDEPEIRIAANDDAAAEDAANDGQFTISLDSGTAERNITVSYSISGTAKNGTDYAQVSGTATIGAGTGSTTVDVTVTDDSLAECDETVTLTLTGTSCGSIDAASSTDTVTISDDGPVIDIAANDAAAAESAANDGQFTIALDSGTAERNITVSYTVAGTAQNGTDYTLLSGTATINAGAGSTTVDVTVTDDSLAECDETVILTLTGTSCGSIDPAGSSDTVTISDDEPEISIAATDASAAEDAANDGQFTISLDSGTAERNITVSYAVSGTARNGTDYTTVSGTATINAGAGSTTVDVTVTDDSVAECDETVILTLTGTSCGSIDTAASTATVTISDDVPEISINANDASAAESAANDGQFTISLDSGTAERNITVSYSIAGTATNGTDYTTVSGTATIAAGTGSTTVNVTVTDDSLAECDETVILTLTGASCGTIDSAASTDTVTISDDEPEISISATDPAAAESAANDGQFTIALDSGTAERNITVSYTVSGTATNGTDYNLLSGTATIGAGNSDTTVDITVIDESLAECDETVVLTLTGTSCGTIDNAASTDTVTITEPDPSISLVAGDDSAAEPATSNNGQFVVRLDGGQLAQRDITVSYAVTGTATNGADYTTIPASATISAGTGSAAINLVVLNDTLVECDETVVLTLTGVSCGTVNGATSTDSATITEPDVAVALIVPDAAASEPAGGNNGAFAVTLGGQTAERDITVTYRVGGTASNGTDYTTIQTTVTISAGTGSTAIPVTVSNDTLAECDETVILTLTGTSCGVVSGASSTGTVTITEPSPSVSLAAVDPAAAEPESADNDGVFAIRLDGGQSAQRAITVTYSVGGTADNGNDYATLSGVATISAGATSTSVVVDVEDDALGECDETVILTLTAVSCGVVNSANSTDTVSISDPDPTISLIVPDPNGAEQAGANDDGEFVIRLDGGLLAERDLTITYTITGSATEGTDYTAIGNEVIVTAGSNSVSIPITVADDTLAECDETVTLTLISTTCGMINGGSSTGTVTITEPDATISLVANDADAAEPAGTNDGQFTIRLEDGQTADRDIAVTYTIAGTADNGTDYTAIPATATISAGSGSTTIAIDVLNDALAECDETVILTLTGTSCGVLTTGSSTDTVTITESAHTVSLVATDGAASEPAGSNDGEFAVRLDGGQSADRDITVTYTVAGTATNGTDYVTIATTATISAGTTSTTIAVDVLDDTLSECDETVILTLTATSCGDLNGASTNATVTLTETTPAITLVASDSSASEPAGGNDGAFAISLPAGQTAERDITVTFSISGTATNGTDYTTIATTAIISAGTNSTTIAVTVSDDLLAECDETVTLTLTTASCGSVSAATATVTITETNPVISLVASDDAGAEPAGTDDGEFVVRLEGGQSAQRNITVNYTISGTATNSTDYATIAASATINAGTSSTTIAVDVSDDTVAECDETVVLTVTSVSCGVVSGGSSIATVTIGEPDPSISLSATDADANEPADDGTFTISIDNGDLAERAITVSYTVSGTATNGTDYALISDTATIGVGTSSVAVTIDVSADSLAECDETVILTLTGASCGTINAASTTDMVTIGETVPSISLVASDSTAAEPNDDGEFAVRLEGGLTADRDITVTYTISGTATNGTDYATITTTATIAAGTSSTTIAIDVATDTLAECDETVTLTLSAASCGAINGGSSGDTVTITETDPTISLFASDADAAEQAGANDNGEFTISIDGGRTAERDITVTFTVGGTASNGQDYDNIGTTGTILAGSNNSTIDILVRNDNLAECDETVVLTLTNSSCGTVSGANSSGTVTISEPTRTFSLTANDSAAAEPAGTNDGQFTIRLDASQSAQRDIIVTYTIGGTATNGTDYAPIADFATIFAGTGFVHVDVDVSNDSMAECDETVTLTVSGSSCGAANSAATSAVVTIADIAQSVSLAVTDSFGKEGQTPADDAEFTVLLDNGQTADFDIVVSYSVSGNASNGSDYATLNGVVTISDGSVSAAIAIDVTDDAEVESTETVTATLTAAEDCIGIGSTTRGSAQIGDDDTFIDVRVTDVYRENHWVPVRIDVSSVPLQTLVFSLSYPTEDLRYNNQIDPLVHGTGTSGIAGPTPITDPRVVSGSDYFAVEQVNPITGMTKLWLAVDGSPQAAISSTPQSPPEQGEITITDTRLGSVLELGFRIRVGAVVKTDSITFVLGDLTAFAFDGTPLPIPERINDPIDVDTQQNRGDFDESGVVQPLSDAVAFYRALLWGQLDGLVPILPESQRNPFDHTGLDVDDNDLPHRTRDYEIIALVKSMVAEVPAGISVVDFDSDGSVNAGRDGPYYVRRLRALSYGLSSSYTVPANHGLDTPTITAINSKIDGFVSHGGADYGEVNDALEAAYGDTFPGNGALIGDVEPVSVIYNESLRFSNADTDLYDGATIGAAISVNGGALTEGVDYTVELDRDARRFTLTPIGTWPSGALNIDVDNTLLFDVEGTQSSGNTAVTFNVP